jgi:hypothetical protein
MDGTKKHAYAKKALPRLEVPLFIKSDVFLKLKLN